MSVVAPQPLPQNPVPGGQRRLRTPPAHRTAGGDESSGEAGENTGVDGGPQSPHESMSGGRTRGGRAAGMSNDEWARQRKDNHVSISEPSSFLDHMLLFRKLLSQNPFLTVLVHLCFLMGPSLAWTLLLYSLLCYGITFIILFPHPGSGVQRY